VRNLLLDPVVKNVEVSLLEPGDKSPKAIGDRHRQTHEFRLKLDLVFWLLNRLGIPGLGWLECRPADVRAGECDEKRDATNRGHRAHSLYLKALLAVPPHTQKRIISPTQLDHQ